MNYGKHDRPVDGPLARSGSRASPSRSKAIAVALIADAAGLASALVGASAPVLMLALAGLLASPEAQALTCTKFNSLQCISAPEFQYAGGFAPDTGYGGFGGAPDCTVTRTPVVFIHGNADSAYSWDARTSKVPKYTRPPRSVYQAFKHAGYEDCELFGVNYLDARERRSGMAAYNYHKESKYRIIEEFISAVKSYTHASRVDLVTHSLGVSMTIATLDYYHDWGSVRRFVNIAGGLHGLDSCEWVGYANPFVPTCGSQNLLDHWVFGFYPDAAHPGINPWTARDAAWYSLPQTAVQNPDVQFYTIDAGTHDEVMCATVSDYRTCGKSPLFTSAGNVKAQLDVGAGSDTRQVNWDWVTNGYPAYPNVTGGDTDGVGHFYAKDNTGSIIVEMLTTNCAGIACASTYRDNHYGPVSAQPAAP